MLSHVFSFPANGRLRSIVLPGGQGGLFHRELALTRFSDADPLACGPEIFLRDNTGRIPADLSWTVEVEVPAGVDIEIRKISLTNESAEAQEIELTTYAEISLNHPLGDAGHPAFAKLFVQTSATGGMLLARRRPRGANENWPWMAQTLVGPSGISWETNRATFLGRGRTLLDPAALDAGGPLSGQTGNVLDPVFAWRGKISVAPRATTVVWLLTAVASDQQSVRAILENHRTENAVGALWKTCQPAEISPHYRDLTAAMMFGSTHRTVPPSMAGSDAVLRHPLGWDEFRLIATGGWNSPGTRELLGGLPYWKSLNLNVRVFIMDAAPPAIVPENVIFTDPASFSSDELAWWFASAQLVADESSVLGEPVLPQRGYSSASDAPDESAELQGDLRHFNGYGGFAKDGREYLIPLSLANGRLKLPPMPWANVLANPDFGCTVTERGAGYTWGRNSQANRITPWSNDPIRDPLGETISLRDRQFGASWSPLPGACPPRSSFIVRHGFGRSQFLSRFGGLVQTVEILVPADDPVKLVSLRLKNESGTARELTLSQWQKLILGSMPDRHQAILAWSDADLVQHAENPRAGDFSGGRVFAFATVHGAAVTAETTCHSSRDFQSGTLAAGPGFGRDACFAREISFTLEPGAEVEIILGLGETMAAIDEARIVRRYTAVGAFAVAHQENDALWQRLLGGVRIETPLPEVDVMVNGWLLYQNIGCRIWGRSAFYQSGGAFGFRDQLQDSGALAAFHPEMMRAQILIHAAQQFPEGDVTHWWHPAPMDRGMRTKFSDDLLWLPFLVGHYLDTTGDLSVLGERLPFIEGPILKDGEDENYLKLTTSDRSVTVFEHCCLAIDKSLTKGAHGLPLIGIGDWNDGMSRIGREGRGESVWMAFFLYTILNRWIPLVEHLPRAATYAAYRDDLLTAIDTAGWDGEWYRRAYYDDGTPLGTHTGEECRIDALAQAWAVISGAAPADRAKLALDAVARELAEPAAGIIKLLAPPFVDTPHDPGYIKGYVDGVRENGGQYTHAACWVVRAMAEAGRRDEAAAWLQRLTPVWHSRDATAVATYQVEPYVVAADIYGAEPHIGRGGWTWYTGSAGWLFRVALESVLGLTVENGDTLVLDPRIPDGWPGYSIDFRTPSGNTLHRIQVTVPAGNARGVASLSVDGKSISVADGIARWPIPDDGADHLVQVILGATENPA